jgi:UDP-N-acetylmuramoyl-tripeptide--D-alanyl-D-alanine ligase
VTTLALAQLLILLAFCAFSARRLLTYLHIFQQEEYDGGRFLRWLLATRSVDRKLSLGLIAIGLIAIAIGRLGIWPPAIAETMVFVAAAFLESDPRKEAKKKLVLTPRAQRIFAAAMSLSALSALGGAALFVMPAAAKLWFLVWIVLVQLLPLDLVLANLLLGPVESRIQEKFWNEAHAKIRRLRPVVIGITGSYGKTSVKHILGHILEAAGSTLVTPGSVNTPMGIARIVREHLQPWHHYFVVEMGAYGPGSIARLCRLVGPTFGLVTAIGKAHFERFKSLDAVARTKFELAEAVADASGKLMTFEDVLAFPAAKAFAAAHPDVIVLCGQGATLALNIKSIRQEPQALWLELVWQGQLYPVAVPLYGTQQAANVAIAFAAACTLGIDPHTIVLALRTTPQIAHRLEVKHQANGSILIDDAYNSNPVGFSAALDLVVKLKGPSSRGILITPGMVELGAAHHEEHARLGHKSAGIIDVLLAVVPERIASFVDAWRASKGPTATLIACASFAEANRWLAGNVRAGDVVLIENDLPDLYEHRLHL